MQVEFIFNSWFYILNKDYCIENKEFWWMFTVNFLNHLLHKLIVRNQHCQIMKKELFGKKSISMPIHKMPFFFILKMKLLYSIGEMVCMNANFNYVSWKEYYRYHFVNGSSTLL